MLPRKYQDQLFPTDRANCPYSKKGCTGKCSGDASTEAYDDDMAGGDGSTGDNSGGEIITIVGVDKKGASANSRATIVLGNANSAPADDSQDGGAAWLAKAADYKAKAAASASRLSNKAKKKAFALSQRAKGAAKGAAPAVADTAVADTADAGTADAATADAGTSGRFSPTAAFNKLKFKTPSMPSMPGFLTKSEKVGVYKGVPPTTATQLKWDPKDKRTLVPLAEVTDKVKNAILKSTEIWEDEASQPEIKKQTASSAIFNSKWLEAQNNVIDYVCDAQNTDNADEFVKYSKGDLYKTIKDAVKAQTGDTLTIKDLDNKEVKGGLTNTLKIPETTKLQNLNFKEWNGVASIPQAIREAIENAELEHGTIEGLENHRFLVDMAAVQKVDPGPCARRKHIYETGDKSGLTPGQRVTNTVQKATKATAAAATAVVKGVENIVTPPVSAIGTGVRSVFTTGFGSMMEKVGNVVEGVDPNALLNVADARHRAQVGGSCPAGEPNVEYECSDWASMFSKQNPATCRGINDFTEEWMCWDWPYKWISPPIGGPSKKSSPGFVGTIFSKQKYNTKSIGDSASTFWGCAFSEYWIFIRALFKWLLRLFKKGDGTTTNPMAADIFPILIGCFIIIPLVISGFINTLAFVYSTLKNLNSLWDNIGGGWVLWGTVSPLWLLILLILTGFWMAVGNFYGLIVTPIRCLFTLIFVPWLISKKICKEIIKCNISTFMMIFGFLIIKSAYLSLQKNSANMMLVLYIILGLFKLFTSRTSAGKEMSVNIQKMKAQYKN